MPGPFVAIFSSLGSLIFALLLLALPLSWWRATRRLGIMLGTTMLLLVGVIGVLPLHDWLLRPLEEYFPVPELPAKIDGVIVLGGAEEPGVMAARGWPELNSNADRLIGFVALARQYPEARLVFTGGAAVLRGDRAVSEADVAAAVFAKLGLDPDRVTYERASRNTAENARLSHALIQPKPDETWILVTSARHLPRAVNTFHAVGWQVIPYPVDFLTGKPQEFEFSPLRRLSGFNFVAKEVLGLLWYRIQGWTSDLLPARRTAETKP
ncbi:YdcF family protein [Ferrovibrio sp.]|uniref:YdcF family protein n=1 Tax=Ferrovibrio sp. TaxID=1917215 RepID=UPI000CA74ACF|nr:YdcF family protein [Ferrovibrio sp.]PJI38133.1 MAG: hypothetical protein CTR53_17510 [Ferrovibrio sp.]